MSLTKIFERAANARWSVLLACCCFVFAVGCVGGGGGGNNGNNGNNGGNNGGMDAGQDTTEEDTTSGEDGTSGEDTTQEDTTQDDTGGGECTAGQPIGDCDPLCGTGCEDGQTCQAGNDPNSGDFTTTCVPSGDNTAGQECGADAGGCAAGFGCLAFSETEPATCMEYCRAGGSSEDPQCSNPDESCTLIVEGGNIGVCQVPEQNCETFPPEDTCGEGQNCYPLQNGGQDCFGYNTDAQAGDACTAPNECNDLQACLGDGSGNAQCFDKCDPSASESRCGADETCQAVDGADFGACAPSSG